MTEEIDIPAPTSSGSSSLPVFSAKSGVEDFLDPDNLCGQNLLRLTARGSSIVAELLRLSTNIPDSLLGPEKTRDPEQLKYNPVLFDFQYLRAAEDYEKKLNDDVDLLDLDQEFQENHEDILNRFFKLFESVHKYWVDMCKYIEDVKSGVYIQHSLSDIVQNVNGKQLMCEMLYLYGVMLLFLEEHIPGPIREKMMIAIYRFNGEGMVENIEDIFKLCRNTGYLPGPTGKKPKNHPVAYFGRFPLDPEYVKLVVGALQGDDIYMMDKCFPNPDHRTTRLAGQASMLYVILYFLPDVLDKAKPTMREVVDKHFNDNWIVPIYMGHLADLQKEWAHHPAAKQALNNVITPNYVKVLEGRNRELIDNSIAKLKFFLNEGVLQQDYVLDNMTDLMNCVRSCNIAFRWRVLHRRCSDPAMCAVIHAGVTPQVAVTLLLNTSQLEFILKDMLQELLDAKEQAWTTGKDEAADRMTELAEYFTGEKALTRVKRNEDMMTWFASLASTIRELGLEGDHATAIGRKIQKLCDALEEVERFEAIDTNPQIKAFLEEARSIFKAMIRTVNIKHEVLSHLENISDASYAWVVLGDYLPVFHDHVSRDPASVVLLRATFLKTASILDVPMVRILLYYCSFFLFSFSLLSIYYSLLVFSGTTWCLTIIPIPQSIDTILT
jgi:WASH complex subunit strumpellin